MDCASCGFPNPEGFRFCGQCGEALGTPDAGVASVEAERRQLTVMFCDLVESTALSERLDPEELRDVIRAYQDVATSAVRRFEGTVAQYLGDGVLVYFGFPAAHEDDAQRAARAALEILAGMVSLNDRLESELGVRLALRVGIHTGPVVVGEIGGPDRRERAAIGETPNIASRLSDEAPADTVVVTGTTHRLLRGLFASEALGNVALRGLSQPISAYRLLPQGADVEPRDDGGGLAATPFVGREQECERLLERWGRARQGDGQVVFVHGEAGIGKSRLVRVLRERIAPDAPVWIEGRCSSYHRTSALYPVIQLLQQLADFRPDDPSATRLEKLEALVGRYSADYALAVPLLAALLSVPFEGRYELPAMTPLRQKQRTQAALVGILLAVAEADPVVLVMDDLHWIDPSTLELLTLLIDPLAAARVLLVLTFRPDFEPPWPSEGNTERLSLNRLPRRQLEELVTGITGGATLPPELLDQVVAKADGVPLFAEELTKMVLESELVREQEGRYLLTDAAPSLAIPSTLQDSLMARLDRLAAVKQVAQLAAVIGRSFSYELLKSVAQLEEPTLRTSLDQLTDAELLYVEDAPPRATYVFKHALIQDAAYQSLLHGQRRRYHDRIARALETGAAETEPELIAHHYTEAGRWREAIAWWLRAGQRSVARSANEEAIEHLNRGTGLVHRLESASERIDQELALQTTLGVPLTMTRGYAAPEAERAFNRALSLARELGEVPQLFGIVRGLIQYYSVAARFDTAREMADQLARLVEKSPGDTGRAIEASWQQGGLAIWTNHIREGHAHLERAIAIYDPARHRGHAFVFGEEPGMAAHVYQSWATWFLGRPDRAVHHVDEALAIATEARHPYSLAFAHSFAAATHRLRRDPERTAESAEAAVRIGTDQGLPFWLAMGTMFRGYALTHLATRSQGIAEIRRGLTAWQETGARLGLTFVMGMLAEAYLEGGDADRGLDYVSDALERVEAYGERFWEAELLRLRAEMLRRLDASPDEVRRFLERSLALSREAGTLSFELRAATSLARVEQAEGAPEAARALLAPLYARFDEGLDTPDLVEARALLAGL